MTDTNDAWEQYQAATKFVGWIEKKVALAGSGAFDESLNVQPSGRFWLGRLASEEQVLDVGLGDRGERLEPCAIGIRVKPKSQVGPWAANVECEFVLWRKQNNAWQKTAPFRSIFELLIQKDNPSQVFTNQSLDDELTALVGVGGLTGQVQVDVEHGVDGELELTFLFVNRSPSEHSEIDDTRFYETQMRVSGFETKPFIMESLPDSFRYDRRVPAYGINCGVHIDDKGTLRTTDGVGVSTFRPKFWPDGFEEPTFDFTAVGEDPFPLSAALLNTIRNWGESVWSPSALKVRAIRENWTEAMAHEANDAAAEFWREVERIAGGVLLLEESRPLHRAFTLMNHAMAISARGKYSSWRPFQFGFLLANLNSIVDIASESAIADIVWFATGGGKTETYLGLLITAAFYDRLRGKKAGITAWSRFPLRMLSLQQTQRFADAFAAAELIRRNEQIPGDSFSLGFFIGGESTPNAIKETPEDNDRWNRHDDTMPARVRILESCPFCRMRNIEMGFNGILWKLEHKCTNPECSWKEGALPFYVVDEEIYRFLPTIVVGTLDKAANIARQASMRAFVGSPIRKCPKPGHGYTYAPRSNRVNGCLVPGCRETAVPLDQPSELFPPSFRLQDELHLLRDSLGAVDSHYEALYDHLQKELSGQIPKILASSATLTGYERQVDVLYRRTARVFPQPGPSKKEGFWSSDSSHLMRRFVAVAPRGVTVEYTIDRLLSVLQTSIRELASNPQEVCRQLEVDPKHADLLISLYGTNVVYGNTLRDLDAVVRSIETPGQVQIEGSLNTASLTGRTMFEDVRGILHRLESPENTFDDRLHVISASSMMSHGVDVDRLNIMLMVGLPLGTAEFIQSTARVGRRWPGLVFVVHKIGRERDASIFRSFEKFVEQGDRFIEPIPVSRKSRRVLERTIAGMELARLLMIHEPSLGVRITTAQALRDVVNNGSVNLDSEAEEMIKTLAIDPELDAQFKSDIQVWFERFRRLIGDKTGAKWPSDLSPTGAPMLSLRDVEEQVPVIGKELQ